MNKILTYFKNLLTSFLFWIKPPKIGQIEIEVQETQLKQDVRVNQDALEVNLEDWQELIKDVFETNHFVTDDYQRAVRPNDEILKQQIQSFYKDYRYFNKRCDQLYTKTKVYDDI